MVVTKLCAAWLSAVAKPQLSELGTWAGAPDSFMVIVIALYDVLLSRYLIWPSIWEVIWPIWFCRAMMSLMLVALASSARSTWCWASALPRRALRARYL